jgi:hypothetical protein
MRVILAHLTWHLDFGLCLESMNWLEQKVHFLWAKSPLMIQARYIRQICRKIGFESAIGAGLTESWSSMKLVERRVGLGGPCGLGHWDQFCVPWGQRLLFTASCDFHQRPNLFSPLGPY